VIAKKLCDICQKNEANHWDHDHETGYVRGRLCGKCNRGLGFLEWPNDWFKKAIAYLENPPLVHEQISYKDIDRENQRRAQKKYSSKLEVKTKKLQYQRKWREENRDKILEYQRRSNFKRNIIRVFDPDYGRGQDQTG
jgi:hypothetical protein